MRIRVLDLDGTVAGQRQLLEQSDAEVIEAADWGPRIRLGCSLRRFKAFAHDLDSRLGAETSPTLTFLGSGDFHHVSLALLRRFQEPFNLLVIDNHPDWMRGIPLMHCGTWVQRALQETPVQYIFHVGGDVDFDNSFRWLAPWPALRSGRIQVFPSVRRFQKGEWKNIIQEPVRPQPRRQTSTQRLAMLLEPHRKQLQRWPLYISLDKDVMTASEAVVNWDSGRLRFREVAAILEAFTEGAEQRLAGMDIVGDWSPVRCQGWLRKFLHWSEHPELAIDPAEAMRRNEEINLALIDMMASATKEALVVAALASRAA